MGVLSAKRRELFMTHVSRTCLVLILLVLPACSRERLVVLFPTGDIAVQQRDLIALATLLMLTVVGVVERLVFPAPDKQE